MLRDYQIKAIEDIERKFDRGENGVCFKCLPEQGRHSFSVNLQNAIF